jgi:hypothetical protein
VTFSINRLVGNRAVISGADFNGVTNSVIVDTTQWDEINANKNYDQAVESFEAAVEEFFAPLNEAMDKINTKLNQAADPLTYVVLDEGQEAVAGKAQHLVKLSHDSIVLRLVETDPGTRRLMWVGDSLEVLEADTPLPGVDGDDAPAYDTEG